MKQTAPKHFSHRLAVAVFLVITALISGGIYYWQQSKVTKYEEFAKLPNQACIGISKGVARGINLDHLDLNATQSLGPENSQGMIVQSSCTIGKNSKDLIKGIEVAEIDTHGFELGAYVMYFKDAPAAAAYAKNNLEPRRYWNWRPEDSPKRYSSVIPVNLGHNPSYFDAYTVKDTAVLRISLPCEFIGNTAPVASLQCFSAPPFS